MSLFWTLLPNIPFFHVPGKWPRPFHSRACGWQTVPYHGTTAAREAREWISYMFSWTLVLMPWIKDQSSPTISQSLHSQPSTWMVNRKTVRFLQRREAKTTTIWQPLGKKQEHADTLPPPVGTGDFAPLSPQPATLSPTRHTRAGKGLLVVATDNPYMLKFILVIVFNTKCITKYIF